MRENPGDGRWERRWRERLRRRGETAIFRTGVGNILLDYSLRIHIWDSWLGEGPFRALVKSWWFLVRLVLATPCRVIEVSRPEQTWASAEPGLSRAWAEPEQRRRCLHLNRVGKWKHYRGITSILIFMQLIGRQPKAPEVSFRHTL